MADLDSAKLMKKIIDKKNEIIPIFRQAQQSIRMSGAAARSETRTVEELRLPRNSISRPSTATLPYTGMAVQALVTQAMRTRSIATAALCMCIYSEI